MHMTRSDAGHFIGGGYMTAAENAPQIIHLDLAPSRTEGLPPQEVLARRRRERVTALSILLWQAQLAEQNTADPDAAEAAYDDVFEQLVVINQAVRDAISPIESQPFDRARPLRLVADAAIYSHPLVDPESDEVTDQRA